MISPRHSHSQEAFLLPPFEVLSYYTRVFAQFRVSIKAHSNKLVLEILRYIINIIRYHIMPLINKVLADLFLFADVAKLSKMIKIKDDKALLQKALNEVVD